MKNRDLAIQFLETCALMSPKDAFEKFVSSDFKHHNQYFKGDGETLMKAMMESDREAPNLKFEVKQVFEQEDRVAVFSRVVKKEMEIAVVHILRFKTGKITEMWDVGQVIEKNCPNENGVF